MDLTIRDKFLKLWRKYFDGAELPITFYYTDEKDRAELVKQSEGWRCLIGDLVKVRSGKPLCFDIDSIGCAGGRKYVGFSHELRADFEYFLSYGIPGKLEGERYKKTPELVKEFLRNAPVLEAPAKFIVFKRWDMLDEKDNPEVVIFFAKPDILSGLFTLTNYDEAEPNGVFAPFAAGCGTIVQYPYMEKNSDRPRAVLGMLDVSARPFIPENTLSFSIPIKKFVKMIENMEESFLITNSWKKVQNRIDRTVK